MKKLLILVGVVSMLATGTAFPHNTNERIKSALEEMKDFDCTNQLELENIWARIRMYTEYFDLEQMASCPHPTND